MQKRRESRCACAKFQLADKIKAIRKDCECTKKYDGMKRMNGECINNWKSGSKKGNKIRHREKNIACKQTQVYLRIERTSESCLPLAPSAQLTRFR